MLYRVCPIVNRCETAAGMIGVRCPLALQRRVELSSVLNYPRMGPYRPPNLRHALALHTPTELTVGPMLQHQSSPALSTLPPSPFSQQCRYA